MFKSASLNLLRFAPESRLCGSAVFATVDGADEVEVRVGAFDDAPTDLTPTYELLWVPRRERWFVPVASAEQHEGNRT
jgi:hypothetical protein